MAAKPVADVVGVAVIQSYTDGIIENQFKVCEKIGINKVACFLECIVNVIVGFCVIEIDADGVLGRCEVEVINKVSWRCGIFIRVSDTKL